ncbi:MAG: hypothetical protein QG576_149 [Bacteroidota bacterium]|nr:hypothetical protein [Bacteroidota bacterium]MDQ1332115.1 hypothetical protein [Bacteroidota bacterium]
MNNLSGKKLLIPIIFFSLSSVVCEAQTFERYGAPKQGRRVVKKGPIKSKEVKIQLLKSIEKAKKKQEANDKKLRNDYRKFVKWNRKRSIKIQTPEVQMRMKQNIKNANSSYRTKKKNSALRTKKAGRKYS